MVVETKRKAKPAVKQPVKRPVKKAPVVLADVDTKEVAPKVENKRKAPPQRKEAAQTETKVPEARPVTGSNGLTWQPKAAKASTKTECIVIDSNNVWHDRQLIELQGMDVSECTWGYYGRKYPVLVEKNGKLVPYVPVDEPGESPHKVYIASKSAGYKGYMKIVNALLHKVQVGMMALLVVGVFFLIYLLTQM